MTRCRPGIYVIHNAEDVTTKMEIFVDNERIEVLGNTISTVYVRDNLYWNESGYNNTRCFVQFMGSHRYMSVGNASNVR